MHGEFFDRDETRGADEREAALMERLRACVSAAKAASTYYREHLDGIHAEALVDRAALARIPVTRKSDLPTLQRARPPFGGLALHEVSAFRRIFASPGPVFEPERMHRDPWRLARAFHAAGVRAGELVYNTFSYHFTPAGRMVESAAHLLGCPVFPAGVGQSDLQARTVADLAPAAYAGTPSFLKIILDKADELDLDASALAKGLVSGEAFPDSLREHFEARGVSLLQCYATADVGLIAYESPARSGLIADEEVIVEIVRPGTGEPVATGEVGEVLVTTLDTDYPMLRLATGDLSASMSGPSPCGRTNLRIAGWMGRADQTAKVRGMFIHPSMVAEIVDRCPEVTRARLRVGSEAFQDTLVLECEARGGDGDLSARLVEVVRDVTKLRAQARVLEAGGLPNDGRVIVDERTYE